MPALPGGFSLFLGVALQSERLLGKNACYDSLFDCCAAARDGWILHSSSAQINGLANFVEAGKTARSFGLRPKAPDEKTFWLMLLKN
jgi:hypothetical protein